MAFRAHPTILLALVSCLLTGGTLRAADATTIALAQLLDVGLCEFEFAAPVRDRNPFHGAMTIAGRPYRTGVGVQVETTIAIAVNGATRFTTFAGVDDVTGSNDAVVFAVHGDGRVIWQSEPMVRGQLPVLVDVDLRGVRDVLLVAREAGHAFSQASGCWADALFSYTGEPPRAAAVPPLVEEAVILTPPAPLAPRINSARVFGVRPWRPFLFTVAASGERPLTYSAEGLPAGLQLDPMSGRITGSAGAVATHHVKLRATNAHGVAEQTLRIEVGDTIALTPPLGWNSWNCWGTAVDQEKVLAAARAMVSSGLAQYGWAYVNIDDAWQAPRPGPHRPLPGNAKFPDIRALADEVHGLGLKLGIYSTPWKASYALYPGGSADDPAATWTTPAPRVMSERHARWEIGRHSFAAIDAQQWNEWGIDYLKYDWTPNELPEAREMAEALRASGRDIVYSLANTTPMRNAGGLAALANLWRATGDIEDNWGSVLRIALAQEQWRRFAGPGRWNDPDMLVVGMVGWGPELHPTRLTPNEQYLHVSLWSLLAAPLLIGCDLEQLDAFTLGLLTNHEVLALNQDPLGRPAALTVADGRRQVWTKPLEDGSLAVGLFNFSRRPEIVGCLWAQLGLSGPQRVRDVWRQQDIGVHAVGYSAEIPRHGVLLLRVWPAASGE